MELTNFSFLSAKNQHNASLALKNQAMTRLANGNRLNAPGVDSGALAVSMNLNSKQKVLSGKMTSIQNSISYLKTQEGAINSAMKIIDRISRIKTLALSPTLSDEDKRSYNVEFIGLSDQLNSLKQRSFNNISLFSEVETGAGLFSASTEAFNFSPENGLSGSISRHVVDFEDLRYITEAGDAAKRGFGGIDVAYFPSTESQKQMETITIGGNIAHGDKFWFNIKEQTALLETESDTPFEFIAKAVDESAPDPQEVVRDDFYNQLTADANIMNFLDVEKVGANQLRLTAKMKGDPYVLHNYDSTSSTGSISEVETVPNVPNDAKEHTATINLGGASIYANDTISMVVSGTTISYQASLADQNDHDQWVLGLSPGPSGTDILADGLANKINNTAAVNANVGAVGNRKMNGAGQLVYSSGSVLLYSMKRGTDFTASGENISLAAPTGGAATFSGTETQANRIGGSQKFSIQVGSDDTATGTGYIAKGDVYSVEINEERHADERDDPYTWWTDPKTPERESHSVSAAAGATANQIRTQLVNKINANSSLVTASNGASRELVLTSKLPGEEYSVFVANGTPDSLTKNQDAPNISPFSIESSMNFLSAMLAQNGAEQSRLNIAHENLENHYAFGEQALSRISDTDTAREATQLAKISLKMNLAEQIMSKSARLKDILIPLTNNHFRGAGLSSTL
jgi:flagellin-like hook-associated protein FlgL